mgnify:CR=1 FL=1
MAKERCDDCGVEIRDEEVFRHEQKKFCAKCTAEHLRDKHYDEVARLVTFKRD